MVLDCHLEGLAQLPRAFGDIHVDSVFDKVRMKCELRSPFKTAQPWVSPSRPRFGKLQVEDGVCKILEIGYMAI